MMHSVFISSIIVFFQLLLVLWSSRPNNTGRLLDMRCVGEIFLVVACVALWCISLSYRISLSLYFPFQLLLLLWYCGIVVITLAWHLQTAWLHAMRGGEIIGY